MQTNDMGNDTGIKLSHAIVGQIIAHQLCPKTKLILKNYELRNTRERKYS